VVHRATQKDRQGKSKNAHFDISKQLGEEWNNLPQEEKQKFIDKSNQLREEHKKQYPNYKYCPRKKIKSEDAFGSINPLLVPPNNYVNGHLNRPALQIGYLNGIPFSSGYVCSSCTMPVFSPMTSYYLSIQHSPQTSLLTYYSDTEPATALVPANTATGSPTALVATNTITEPPTANTALVPTNTAFVASNTAIHSNDNQGHDPQPQ